jgi:hypothetical protein
MTPNDSMQSQNLDILVENQQMHQNCHFIVIFSQTPLHVSAYQRHHQGAHMILTSYLYVGVHYKKDNGVSSKLATVSIVTLWVQVVMTNSCWEQYCYTMSTSGYD